MPVNKIKANPGMESKYKEILDTYPSLRDTITQEAKTRSTQLADHLTTKSPWLNDQENFNEAIKHSSRLNLDFLNADHDYYSEFMKRTQKPLAKSFWDNELSKASQSDASRDLSHALLMKKWDLYLKQTISEWETQETEKSQAEFEANMDQSLEQFQDLCESVKGSGLDMEPFFDCADGALSQSDFNEIKEWLCIIAKNEKTKEICELMGRVCQASALSKEKQKCHTKETSKYQDDRFKEEVMGIDQSNDLGRVLASELSILGDPEAECLFDLKFLESRLMTYEMSSFQNKSIISDEEHLADIEDGKGPIILCIDTSGSMQGIPEDIAKAVALYMSKLAKKEKRNCYLINFSTSIETLDLSKKAQELIPFLKQSFHGGTDVEPAISHAVELMKDDLYKNADLLVISDEIINSISAERQQEMASLKSQGNRFYELCIDPYQNDSVQSCFDRTWIYSSKDSSVTEREKSHLSSDENV